MVDTRGEEAVGDGLGVHVGELAGLRGLVEVGYEHLGEGPAQIGKRGGRVAAVERGQDHVADHVREPGHPPREFLGLSDVFRLVFEERAEKLADLGRAVASKRELAGGAGVGEPRGFAQLAVDVPPELEIVG